MPSILDEIVADKREELAKQKALIPLSDLESRIASQQIPLDLSRALQGQGVQLMAEVKKASPSRGLLCADFDPVRIAGTYASNGAAAISILTDPRFEGKLDHIARVKLSGVSQ